MSEWFFIVPEEGKVEKKSRGRGHWGHKGRPGKVGGSQPSGSRQRTGIKVKGFDEVAERSIVMEYEGQRGTMKPGITRSQAARYFARLNAVKAARNFRYSGNQNLVDAVDEILDKEGATKYKAKRRGVLTVIELRTPDARRFWTFSRKVETDYLKTIFNKGEFKRNY